MSRAHAHDGSSDRVAISAVLFMSVAGGVVSSLQPLLLGALASQSRITLPEIGQAATLEACGTALIAGVAGARLRPERLRAIAAGAALVATGANLGTIVTSGPAVLAMRGISGLASGLLLWLVVGLFARAPNPARMFGIYVTSLSLASLLLASLFTAWLIPRYGATGGYATLALFDLAVLAAVAFVPRSYSPLSQSASDGRLPSPSGMLGLAAVFLHIAGILALWVYVIPLIVQSGGSTELAGLAVSIAIAAQIAGGIAAVMLAGRLAPFFALMCSLGASLVGIYLLAKTHETGAVCLAVALFGFFWMFAPPFQMPLLLGVDPSRRAVMLMSSAQMFGSGAGPIIASQAVVGSDVRLIAPLAASLLLSSAVLLILAQRFARRSTSG